MNPFELRYQLLNTARDMLESEYHAKKAHGVEVHWPSLEEVLFRAKELNKFVSEK
jgi:hypothetical protein